jgi:KDO2-lipid IV(A) lauroyltransferase
MKRFEQFLVYMILRSIEIVLCSLPMSWAVRIGEALGTLMPVVLPKRRRLIIDNLTKAFPEKTPEAINAIARRSWKNLGRTALEFVRSNYFFSPEMAPHMVWDGAEQMDAALAAQRGVILISFHFTNWEILGMAIQDRFKRMMAIARPMKNPYVEQWVKNKRAGGGMQITLHRDAVKASLRWLKKKNILGVLVDQNLYHGGVFVDFFGRPAATTTLPALLHIRTGAPVFITYCLREGKGLRMAFLPVEFPPVTNEDERIIAYTQTINNYLERIVRAHPENWFWIHNRWKRKPGPLPSA